MTRLTRIQHLLETLPRDVRISIVRTYHEGEQYTGKRNIFSEDKRAIGTWQVRVGMPDYKDVELPDNRRWQVSSTLYDCWLPKDYAPIAVVIDYNGEYSIGFLEISFDGEHLGLLMLRAYRAALWLSEHNKPMGTYELIAVNGKTDDTNRG